jgi:hypothetical protein
VCVCVCVCVCRKWAGTLSSTAMRGSSACCCSRAATMCVLRFSSSPYLCIPSHRLSFSVFAPFCPCSLLSLFVSLRLSFSLCSVMFLFSLSHTLSHSQVIALKRGAFSKRGSSYTEFGAQMRCVRPDQSSQVCCCVVLCCVVLCCVVGVGCVDAMCPP